MASKIDLTGQRFGKLIVISCAPSQNKRVMWNCICDCGKSCTKATKYLRNGDTTSCGCSGAHVCRRTHGLANKIPEHNIWKSMKGRCYRETDARYHRYGGRGIKVCDRWCNSFAAFYSDMGPRPSPKHTLDRIDNDGDYCPQNCRWATDRQQRRNREQNVWYELDGERMIQKDWARRIGCTTATIRRRLKNGWSIRAALTTPPYRP